MQLIVVRHGQAEGNKTHTIMSRNDVGLTGLGHQQAGELARKLNVFNIEIIYSSPLRRAVETIKPFAEARRLTIKIDERLTEVDWGKLIGQPEEASLRYFGKTIDGVYGALDYDLEEFGGESFRQVEARIKSFLEDLKKTGAQTVCAVTHDGIVHQLHYIISGQKISRDPNASIHEFNI